MIALIQSGMVRRAQCCIGLQGNERLEHHNRHGQLSFVAQRNGEPVGSNGLDDTRSQPIPLRSKRVSATATSPTSTTVVCRLRRFRLWPTMKQQATVLGFEHE